MPLKRVLGYTTDELMAKPFIEFVHPEDRDVTKEELAKLGLQKKLFDFTNRYRCKDGNFRWFEWRAVPSGGLIYAAARDVTDRIRSAGELADRLSFKTLLSELSRRFVNVTIERVDSEINDAIQKICEHLGFDLAPSLAMDVGRCTFFHYDSSLSPYARSSSPRADRGAGYVSLVPAAIGCW